MTYFRHPGNNSDRRQTLNLVFSTCHRPDEAGLPDLVYVPMGSKYFCAGSSTTTHSDYCPPDTFGRGMIQPLVAV